MKKQLALGLGLTLGAVVFAGCNKKVTPTETTTEPDTTMNIQTDQTASDTEESMNAAWMDALKSGQGVLCTFTSKDAAETTTAKLKAKKSHIVVTKVGATVATTEMVNDSQYIYTWDPAKKTGFKMKMPTEAELKEMTASMRAESQTNANVPDVSSPEKIQALEEEGGKIDCKPGQVADAEFTIPKDVTFQDSTEVMNKAMEQAKQNMTEEQKKQVEDAMKQFGGN